jgi:predicted restriction endonuclease
MYPILEPLPFTMSDTVVNISPEWAEALRNVASRRSKKHYKPAALLITLDMLDEGEATDGRVPYAAYDKRFQNLMAEADPDGRNEGWQPFLHLATGEQVWDLYRNGRPADLDGLLQRRSRGNLESEVDEARVHPHLVPYLRSRQGRQAIRRAIYDMLEADRADESERLLQVHRRLTALSDELQAAEQEAERNPTIPPESIEDARRRMMREIVQRQGQPGFRRALLAAYGGKCAITGCAVEAALEAAHIQPYLGPHTNTVANGILLRADIHTLFDLHLLTIDPDTFKVRISPTLRDGHYNDLHGRKIALPVKPEDRPDISALRVHSAECGDQG